MKTVQYVLAFYCAALLMAVPSFGADVDRAVSRVFPALVRITVVMEEPGEGSLKKQVGAGSGAVISEDGYVITNHHVAGIGRRMICRMADGEEIEATLVGTDPLADIAILKLDLASRKSQTKIPVATFGDSDKVKLGDTVFAMGSPMAVSQSVTQGIVSNTQLMMPDLFWFMQFTLDGENTGSLVRWIGHDAVIFGGNSGGPLVNLDGEIIGINEVALASLSGAIPSNLAKSVAEQLIKQGYVDRSWTGLEPQPMLRSSTVDQGVLVAGVIADSPAAAAGIKAGDIVTEFDGVAVNAKMQEDMPVFNALVMSTPIGKKVTLKALRGDKLLTFSLTTRARGKAKEKDAEFKDWGFTARDFTMLSAVEHKRPNTDGVMVTSVNPSGPAGSAKPALKEEDCILSVAGQPVHNVADLRAITAELTKNTNTTACVAVEFDRGIQRMMTAVRPKPEEGSSEENARKPGLYMMLQPIGPELAQVIGLKEDGARVAFVYPGGPAERAGIRAGDILTKFDGETVRCQQDSDLSHFMAKVRRHATGDVVECGLLRAGKPMAVKLTLEADDPNPENLKSYKDKELEFTIRDMTNKERVQLQLPADVRGPTVAEVKTSGWANLGHVAVDDLLLAIDGTPTPDTETAEALLKAAAKKKPRRLVFLLRRGVHTLFAELEPTWDSVSGNNPKTTNTRETKQ